MRVRARISPPRACVSADLRVRALQTVHPAPQPRDGRGGGMWQWLLFTARTARACGGGGLRL